MRYKRWKCNTCGRMYNHKFTSCNICKNKKFGMLYSLNKLPNLYFEYERLFKQ